MPCLTSVSRDTIRAIVSLSPLSGTRRFGTLRAVKETSSTIQLKSRQGRKDATRPATRRGRRGGASTTILPAREGATELDHAADNGLPARVRIGSFLDATDIIYTSLCRRSAHIAALLMEAPYVY